MKRLNRRFISIWTVLCALIGAPAYGTMFDGGPGAGSQGDGGTLGRMDEAGRSYERNRQHNQADWTREAERIHRDIQMRRDANKIGDYIETHLKSRVQEVFDRFDPAVMRPAEDPAIVSFYEALVNRGIKEDLTSPYSVIEIPEEADAEYEGCGLEEDGVTPSTARALTPDPGGEICFDPYRFLVEREEQGAPLFEDDVIAIAIHEHGHHFLQHDSHDQLYALTHVVQRWIIPNLGTRQNLFYSEAKDQFIFIPHRGHFIEIETVLIKSEWPDTSISYYVNTTPDHLLRNAGYALGYPCNRLNHLSMFVSLSNPSIARALDGKSEFSIRLSDAGYPSGEICHFDLEVMGRSKKPVKTIPMKAPATNDSSPRHKEVELRFKIQDEPWPWWKELN